MIADKLGVSQAYLMGWEDESTIAKQKMLALWESASDAQRKRILDIMEYVLSQVE